MSTGYIHFAIPPHAPLERRQVARELVAERFDGIAETTELVGVHDYGRLYRMESIPTQGRKAER